MESSNYRILKCKKYIVINFKEVTKVVKIRLRRDGSKKSPYYTMVVADSRYPADGRFIEKVGTYNPMVEPVELKVDTEKVKTLKGVFYLGY